MNEDKWYSDPSLVFDDGKHWRNSRKSDFEKSYGGFVFSLVSLSWDYFSPVSTISHVNVILDYQNASLITIEEEAEKKFLHVSRKKLRKKVWIPDWAAV